MQAITEQHDASTKTFLVIPRVGAFFIHNANALEGFLALSWFAW